MRSPFSLLPLLLLLGCAKPQTVDRAELDCLKQVWHEPKTSMWYYMGSRDGFHYFHHDDLGAGQKDFRISDAEMSWPDTFPLTRKRVNWQPLDWGMVGHMKRDISRPAAPVTESLY